MNLRPLPALLVTMLLLGGTAACSDEVDRTDTGTRSSTPNAPQDPSARSEDGSANLDDLLLSAQDDLLRETQVVPPDEERGLEDSGVCPPLTFPGTTDRVERHFRWANGEEMVVEVRDLGTEEAAESAFETLPSRLVSCLEEYTSGSEAKVRALTAPDIGEDSLAVVVAGAQLQVDVVAARVGTLVVTTGASVGPETESDLAQDAARDQVARLSAAG